MPYYHPHLSNLSSDIKDMVVRLENELDNLIKMFAWSREALEKEMLQHSGSWEPGKHGIPDGLPKKLKELTIGMSSLVECKIRYDKAKKELAKNMTPDEEMAAVVAYIVNLPVPEWDRLRQKIKDKGRWNNQS